jgi:DNA-binding LacI/PurR family transcriptional regulator
MPPEEWILLIVKTIACIREKYLAHISISLDETTIMIYNRLDRIMKYPVCICRLTIRFAEDAPNMASGTANAVQIKRQQPLYLRIQHAMRERIAQGDWAAGQPLPSRVHLCEEFGTTRVTLDKAIHELVREGLLRSAKGSGTFIADTRLPDSTRAAKASKSVHTLRIGIMMGRAASGDLLDKPGTDNYYYGPLFQGVRDAVAGKPVEMVHAHYGQSEYVSFARDNELDGILLVTPLLNELPALHALAAAAIPFIAVGISSHASTDSTLPFVDTDNRQGARDAVDYLLGLGHRRIAIVNLATSQANHHDRLEGYRQALTRAGASVAPGDLLLYPIHESDRLDERIQAWLTQAQAAGSLPTAIFACDYQMAISTMRVLRRNGLRVPEDISVVGFDDPFSAEHLTPALTTVRQPVYQLGRRSAERLLDSLRAGDLPRGAEILPTQLIVRESTCSPLCQSSQEKEGTRI